MKLLFKIALFFFIPGIIFAKNVNVYLKFDDPALHQAIQRFNNYLKANTILSRYGIEPFLNHHPMHLTLFLASYPEDNVNAIKEQVALIAQKWKPIDILTTQIFVTAGNYVMLDLNRERQTNGQNHQLQQLSDEVVMKLTNLRDFNAETPDWAQSIPEKKNAFWRYGSPNVFFEFNPHFSLMAKNFDDPVVQHVFQDEMKQLINAFHFPEYQTRSSIIGIGYVDSFGQITEEIAHYSLNLNS